MGTQAWVRSLVLAMLACPTGSGAEQADNPASSDYARPQRLVEVEPGRRLNLYCIGEGSPTVIFDSGLAEPTSTWFQVKTAGSCGTPHRFSSAGKGADETSRR